MPHDQSRSEWFRETEEEHFEIPLLVILRDQKSDRFDYGKENLYLRVSGKALWLVP